MGSAIAATASMSPCPAPDPRPRESPDFQPRHALPTDPGQSSPLRCGIPPDGRNEGAALPRPAPAAGSSLSARIASQQRQPIRFFRPTGRVSMAGEYRASANFALCQKGEPIARAGRRQPKRWRDAGENGPARTVAAISAATRYPVTFISPFAASSRRNFKTSLSH